MVKQILLADHDNHKRSIAAQLLSKLAISDYEGKYQKKYALLWKNTQGK